MNIFHENNYISLSACSLLYKFDVPANTILQSTNCYGSQLSPATDDKLQLGLYYICLWFLIFCMMVYQAIN